MENKSYLTIHAEKTGEKSAKVKIDGNCTIRDLGRLYQDITNSVMNGFAALKEELTEEELETLILACTDDVFRSRMKAKNSSGLSS